MARKKKERESSLHLTDKHHPLLGIVATLLAVLSAGMFGAACVAASGGNGHAGLLVGFVGICSLVVAGVGFVLAWISLHQEDIRPHFPFDLCLHQTFYCRKENHYVWQFIFLMRKKKN